MAVAQDLIASSRNRVVVGLGVTGLSCARHLYAAGKPFSVIDSRAEPPGLAELQSEMPDVPVFCGEYPARLVESAEEWEGVLEVVSGSYRFPLSVAD